MKNLLLQLMCLVICFSSSVFFNAHASEKKKLIQIVLDTGATLQSRKEALINKKALVLKLFKEIRRSENDDLIIVLSAFMPKNLWVGSREVFRRGDKEAMNFLLKDHHYYDRKKNNRSEAACSDLTETFRLIFHNIKYNPSYDESIVYVFSPLLDTKPHCGKSEIVSDTSLIQSIKENMSSIIPDEQIKIFQEKNTQFLFYWVYSDVLPVWHDYLTKKKVHFKMYDPNSTKGKLRQYLQHLRAQ